LLVLRRAVIYGFADYGRKTRFPSPFAAPQSCINRIRFLLFPPFFKVYLIFRQILPKHEHFCYN
jgi:hypothetical protein